MKRIKDKILINSITNKIIATTILFFFLIRPISAESVLEIKESDFVLGDNNAPVTIIEYASLSCSHCANFHFTTLPQIMENYVNTGKVKIVFRDYPLNFPALVGSLLLQCISKDIRYDYMSALFSLQNEWVNKDINITKQELYKIMQSGGMIKEQFNNCLEDKENEKLILENLMKAQEEFEIKTTPSFLINGKLIEGNKSFEIFQKTIDEILSK